MPGESQTAALHGSGCDKCPVEDPVAKQHRSRRRVFLPPWSVALGTSQSPGPIPLTPDSVGTNVLGQSVKLPSWREVPLPRGSGFPRLD